MNAENSSSSEAPAVAPAPDRARGARRPRGINPNSPWWTIQQCAEYLQCGKRFVYSEIKRGAIRAVILGSRRELRSRREWLDAALEAYAAPVAVVPGRRRAG